MQVLNEFEHLVKSEDYDAALAILVKNKYEFESSIYHYNVGVIWAKKSNFVMARKHFELAKASGYVSVELKNNLEEVKNQLGISYLEKSNDLKTKLLDTCLSLDPYTPMIISSLIFISFFMLVRDSFKKVSLLICVSLLPVLVYYGVQENYEKSIVMQDTIVRKGPSGIFEKVQELPGGVLIIHSKLKDGWIHIVSPPHLRGWTNKMNNLERIYDI